MIRLHHALVPAALAGALGSALLAGPAAAVDSASGVWVGQVTDASTTRRTNNPSATDQVLQSFTNSTSDTGPTLMLPSAPALAAASASGVTPNTANNQAILSQFGSNNTGSISQTGSNNTAQATVYGNTNLTTQQQAGTGNSSILTLGSAANPITGSDITTRQDNTATGGPGNSINYTITGNGVTVNTSQIGSGLSATYTYTGPVNGSDKTITIQQLGQGRGTR